MRNYNQFQQGQGCFKCRICGKRTRDVNGSNGSLELCPLCEAICGAENHLSDNTNHPDAFGGVFKHCTTVSEVEDLLSKLAKEYEIREVSTESNGDNQLSSLKGDAIMSDVNTTTPEVASNESVAPPAVETVSKPKAKKPKAKKGTKVKAKAKKVQKAGAPKKDGLRMFQLRALKALQGGGDLTMEQLAKKAKISPVVMRRGIGPVDPSLLKKFDKEQGFPCLQSLGLVRVEESVSANGKGGETKENTYVLTAKGKTAAAKVDALPKVHAAPGEGKK